MAVLPLVSLTGKPEQEFFGEGIAEEIINRLVKEQGLRVIARTLAFQFRDPKQDLRKIARRLQVDVVVTGTVRGDQEKLRVLVLLGEIRAQSSPDRATHEGSRDEKRRRRANPHAQQRQT